MIWPQERNGILIWYTVEHSKIMRRHDDNLPPLDAPDLAVMIICGASSDYKVSIMKTLGF